MAHQKEQKKRSTPKDYLKWYGLTFEMVVLNVVLIVGGYYLDAYLSSSPAAILLGTFLAIAGTIWLLLKFLNE